MSVVALPSTPLYSAGTPYLLSNAVDLVSPMGGVNQRVARLGSRFGIDVTYPAMRQEDALNFLGVMMLSELNPVSIVLPQRGFNPGASGTPLVNGAGQSGSSLAMRGLVAGYTFLAGQLFDFFGSDGRRYVQMVTQGISANGSGNVTVQIAPIMRNSPNDGGVIEITNPTLEGFISLASRKLSWDIQLVRRVGIKLSIVEDR
jgi:hypothetical protein